jgi:acyl-CoA synthetase (AMP-forming)/AMP-acid ligase II
MADLLFDLLTMSAARVPGKLVAKDQNNGRITYSELHKSAQELGRKILSVVGDGHAPIAIFLSKEVNILEAIFGVAAVGRPLLIINRVLSPSQIHHIVEDASCQLFITSREFLASHPLDFEKMGIQACMFLGEKEAVGAWPTGGGEDAKISWFDSRLADTYQLKTPLRIPEDDAMLIYTSGSTGRQKGIVVTHKNLIDGAKIVSGYLGLRDTDIIAGVLPFNFDAGFNQLLSAIYLGATIILIDNQMPNHLFEVLENESVTFITGVPPVWASLLNPRLSDQGKGRDLSHVRLLANTGGKVPKEHLRKIRQVFVNANVCLMYGLTEAFRSTYLPPNLVDKKEGSVGVAVPEVEVSVIDKDGKECTPGEVGEIIHRGAFVSKGYLNDPEKTMMVFGPNPLRGANGYLEKTVFSGDLGYKDDDGYLYIVGRKDAQFKIGGYRLNVSEVEQLLGESPDIVEVIAIPFVRDSEQKLAVFLVHENDDPEESVVKARLRQLLPSYMMPEEVRIVSRMPLGPTGKIDREKLKRSLSKDLEFE